MVISLSDNLSTVDIEASDPSEAGVGVRVTYLVKRLESAVRRDLDAAMHKQGLTTPQYAALSILSRHPGLSSAQLARRAFVTAQSMQVMVANFVRCGYVKREPSEGNQRVLCNYLTSDGAALLAACEESAGKVEERMLDGVDPESVRVLRATLSLCIRNFAKS